MIGSRAGEEAQCEAVEVVVVAPVVIGLRTIGTICAVALMEAMPENRTSIGAALNDTSQEIGSSLGTAIVGTLIAALVTNILPEGTWSSGLVPSFFEGEGISYLVIAVLVGVIATIGSLSLTNSRVTEEPAPSEPGHTTV